MKKWKLFAGIVLVFALGGAAGSLGMGWYIKKKTAPLRMEPKARKTFIIEKLARKLDLTDNQIPKIEKILTEVDLKRRKYRAEIRKIRTESISQMKKELTPEQQVKLDELHEKWKLRRKKKRSLK
jgi:Spy/CpxP family protein refolding chaperone